jgi:hypothetical protein
MILVYDLYLGHSGKCREAINGRCRLFFLGAKILKNVGGEKEKN